MNQLDSVRFLSVTRSSDEAVPLLRKLSTDVSPQSALVDLIVKSSPVVIQGPDHATFGESQQRDIAKSLHRLSGSDFSIDIFPNLCRILESGSFRRIPAAPIGFISMYVRGDAEGVDVYLPEAPLTWSPPTVAQRLIADSIMLSTTFMAGRKEAAPMLCALSERLWRSLSTRVETTPELVAHHVVERIQVATESGVPLSRMKFQLSVVEDLLTRGERWPE